MSQGVIIALLVLAGLLVLRLTNLPPFSGSPSTTQAPTPVQTSPTPITRSTGFSTGVATEASETTPISPNTTQPPSTSTGSGSSTSTGTNSQQPPVRGKW